MMISRAKGRSFKVFWKPSSDLQVQLAQIYTRISAALVLYLVGCMGDDPIKPPTVPSIEDADSALGPVSHSSEYPDGSNPNDAVKGSLPPNNSTPGTLPPSGTVPGDLSSSDTFVRMSGKVTLKESGDWIVLSGIRSVTVELWGGHGDGIGAGGAYSKRKIDVLKDQVLRFQFDPPGGGRGASIIFGGMSVQGGDSFKGSTRCFYNPDDAFLGIPPSPGPNTVVRGGKAAGGEVNVEGKDHIQPGCFSGNPVVPGKGADPTGELTQKYVGKPSGAEVHISW